MQHYSKLHDWTYNKYWLLRLEWNTVHWIFLTTQLTIIYNILAIWLRLSIFLRKKLTICTGEMWDRTATDFFCQLVLDIQMSKRNISTLSVFTKKLHSTEQPASCTDWLVFFFVTNMSHTSQIWPICLQTFGIFSVKIRIVFTIDMSQLLVIIF